MKYLSLILIVVLCILTIILVTTADKNFKEASKKTDKNENLLKIGSCEFVIEFARTDKEKAQGLSGREKLANNSGMLFVYDTPGIYGFWMKDMNVALDFVWILDDKIVDLTENVPPPTGDFIPRIRPKLKVNKVLEINAGKIEECGIESGNTVVTQ